MPRLTRNSRFTAMHDAVRIPVILYDLPSRTACPLADVTIERLAKLPRVVGIKDATGDVARVARLKRRLDAQFLLFSGDDAIQVAFCLAGGDGCIFVTADVAPALCASLLACDRRDMQAVARCAVPRTQPDPVKRTVERLGLMAEELRLPLTPRGPWSDEELARALGAVLPIGDAKARRATRRVSASRVAWSPTLTTAAKQGRAMSSNRPLDEVAGWPGRSSSSSP